MPPRDASAGLSTPAHPGAMRVGGDLRAARDRLGWSLADTAAYLRMRPRLLAALEDGRLDDLPGAAYAIGFVRSYALVLGLDGDAIVRRFREETGVHDLRAALEFPAPLPQRHVPAGAVVMLGAALAVVGYAGWFRASGDQVASVAVQQVPSRLAPLALPVVPPPPVRTAASAPVAVASISVPAASISPGAAEASVPPPGSLAPVDPAPSAAGRLVLSASADAWVQVKDAKGKILLAKLLHAGDSWPVPDPAAGAGPMVLTTGNAGGTILTVDGQAVPPLGGPGVVRHDVSLDPAALRTGAASASATHE